MNSTQPGDMSLLVTQIPFIYRLESGSSVGGQALMALCRINQTLPPMARLGIRRRHR